VTNDRLASLEIGDRLAVDLRAATGGALARLPYSLRIVLENALRHTTGEERQRYQASVLSWLRAGTTTDEVAFQPERLLMHDTTCGPALVDIAGMRDALAERGGDPRVLNPRLRVDVSVDHSIAVDEFGTGASIQLNMRREADRNAERFRLMKWAQDRLDGFIVHPPGTGILHTFNLEQLATIAATSDGADGRKWAFPDTLIGTDSHTPMINGLGVLGWGVGGLEAEGVMFGLPVMMRIPDVIGVRLSGALPEGAMATDLALVVTNRLRTYGLNSQFVEFFGPGVDGLSVGDRSVVANMAPEYGAQTAYFPVDAQSIAYLRSTGRTESLIRFVEAYCRGVGIWRDPADDVRYTDVIDIDLGKVGTSIAGPRRPQDLIAPRDAREAVRALSDAPGTRSGTLEHGSVAIAAITSCTNTTDPRLTIAAGLLARKARVRGLKPKPWVKTSFSPGSPAAARYLERAGLLEDLDATGFGIVGFGCMTCIGNSGPLLPPVDAAVQAGIVPVAVLSGNRNFAGRVHPALKAGFLASPPLVIAYALAGDVNRDILSDPITVDAEGKDVYLTELWPSGAEIDAALAASRDATDFADSFAQASRNAIWSDIPAPSDDLYPWDESSTYLRRPPYTTAAAQTRLGHYRADPILVLGDDISTDQISPAGAIPADSETARYLVAAGENPRDLNVYSARRGNWQAMIRGLYTNATVHNLVGDNVPPGYGIDPLDGEVLPLHVLAERLASYGRSSVIVAGERYGQGSSRDWAAKGPAILGVRAVLAQSFERIHRTNLIGMGILPLRLPTGVASQGLRLRPGDQLEVAADAERLGPDSVVTVTVWRSSEPGPRFEAVADVETALEGELLRHGGIVPLILARALSAPAGRGANPSGHAA
jgi:aconitate hydratase